MQILINDKCSSLDRLSFKQEIIINFLFRSIETLIYGLF